MKNSGIDRIKSVLGQRIDRRQATICQLSLATSAQILMLSLASHPVAHLNIFGDRDLGYVNRGPNVPSRLEQGHFDAQRVRRDQKVLLDHLSLSSVIALSSDIECYY